MSGPPSAPERWSGLDELTAELGWECPHCLAMLELDVRAVEVGAEGMVNVIVLSAARSGEARLVEWDEFDVGAAMWAVPASRLKRRVIHRVPLSARAPGVLDGAERLHDGRSE